MARHTNRDNAKAHLTSMFGGLDFGSGDLGSEMPRTDEGPETYLNRMDARDKAKAVEHVNAGAQAAFDPYNLPVVGPHSKLTDAPGYKERAMADARSTWASIQEVHGRRGKSEAPNFKHIGPWGPVQTDEQGVQHQPLMHYLDPEKHIEDTMRNPGDFGTTDIWMKGKPETGPWKRDESGRGPWRRDVSAEEDITGRQTTRQTYQRKGRESSEPATLEHPLLPGHIRKNPTHGAGILNSIWGSGRIREPVYTIADEEEFGHPHDVQWEGNHRVVAAAMEQKRRRESGRPDWGVPVPVIHLESTKEAEDLRAQWKDNPASRHLTTGLVPDSISFARGVRNRKMLRNPTAPRTTWSPEIAKAAATIIHGRPYEREVTPVTKHEKVLQKKEQVEQVFAKGRHQIGGGFGTGTWNPAAY